VLTGLFALIGDRCFVEPITAKQTHRQSSCYKKCFGHNKQTQKQFQITLIAIGCNIAKSLHLTHSFKIKFNITIEVSAANLTLIKKNQFL